MLICQPSESGGTVSRHAGSHIDKSEIRHLSSFTSSDSAVLGWGHGRRLRLQLVRTRVILQHVRWSGLGVVDLKCGFTRKHCFTGSDKLKMDPDLGTIVYGCVYGRMKKQTNRVLFAQQNVPSDNIKQDWDAALQRCLQFHKRTV